MANTSINTLENIAKVEAIAPRTLNGLPGMSSLEIAEITGKNHKHVLRDIAKMLTELELINESKSGLVNAPASDEVKFARAHYRDAKGESRPLTILNKELTFTLLSRYSFKLANLIVNRWLELEGSGFERVSVQASVVHLIEREKDARRTALRALNRGRSKRVLSPAEKETERVMRAAKRYEAKQRGRKPIAP